MRLRSLPLGARLDRYVLRLFGLSYGAAFLLVVGLFLILDMATHLDDYLAPDQEGYKVPLVTVLRFYALQLPFLYLQMAPYVTLIAGLFTGAHLARANEVVAALNAGLSVRRLFLPLYLAAGLLAAAVFALREGATERLGRERALLQERFDQKDRRAPSVVESLVVRDVEGRTVMVNEYAVGEAPESGRIRGLSALYSRGEVRISVAAREASPISGGRWALVEGQRIEDDGRARSVVAADLEDDLRFSPGDVELAWKAREHPLDLSTGELGRLLAREPTNLQLQTLYQYGLTFPLAGLVLLLVGLPFVVGHERGKAGERIARGFLLCVAYFLVDTVARNLGLQGLVGPLFSGWLPLVLFGSLGVVLTASMRS